MTRDEMIEKLKSVQAFCDVVHDEGDGDLRPMAARAADNVSAVLAALRSRPDDLTGRDRLVLGRLLSEMESLSASMYGEMRDALRKVLSRPAPVASPAPETPAPDANRCAVCGWPLDPTGQMCRRGNCSMRPLPERAYDPARAVREYEATWKGMAGGSLIDGWRRQEAQP